MFVKHKGFESQVRVTALKM